MKKRVIIPDTSLRLSSIGLGTANAGLAWDGEAADRIFDCFLDLGGNLIDTARVYSDWIAPETGRSERVIGDWLRRSGKRQQVILSTKGGHPVMTSQGADLHISRMSARDMRHDLELSLKALGTDMIDIYFYHRDDLTQSVEEEIEVMETFRREGKIRYYGCSNWNASRIREADAYCRENGYRSFAADQALYNLGMQYMNPMEDDTLVYLKDDLARYHEETPENLAMPYMGVATGYFHKYIAGGERAVQGSPYHTPQNAVLARRCADLMEKYEASMTQVVLGFFMCRPFTCVPLYGTRNEKQLAEIARVEEIPFTEEDYRL